MDSYGANKNTHKGKWIRKEVEDGYKIYLKVIDSKAIWNKSEIYWLRLYKHLGYRLVNSTAGGKGVLNPCNEVLEKRSKSMKKVWNKPEKREKILNALRTAYANKIFTEDERQGCRNRMNELWADPEYKNKMLLIHNKGRTQEQKERMRQAALSRDNTVFKSKEFSEKISATLRGKPGRALGAVVCKEKVEKRNAAIKKAYYDKAQNGILNHKAKLTKESVIEVKQMLHKGMSPKDISNIYGVSPSTISDIKSGRTWANWNL